MKWLSRYRPRYVRSLVYMLQASEYQVRDYLAWFHRTSDFSAVEKRKKLDVTPKALALLAVLWLAAVGLAACVVVALWFGYYFVSLFVVLVTPFVLAYGIVIPLAVLNLVQLSIVNSSVVRARVTLGSHRAVKIGIAGSYGKTSMREILKTVLSEGMKVAAPPGSYNTPLGISSFVEQLDGDEEVLIFELGEYYPGDVKKLCELVGPTIGVITGVNEAHLEKFGTLERTAATIFELADYLKEKPVYVNAENELAKKNARPTHFLYSKDGVQASTSLDGTSFDLTINGAPVHFESKLLGLHHVGPLVAAIRIAEGLGLTVEQIQAGVRKTKAFEHRLEPTESGGIVTLDDSYNGNPDGVKAVIDFLAGLTGRRRFFVTPGLVEMGSRKAEVHREIGKWLTTAAIEKVVLVKNSVTPYIAEGLKEHGYRGEVLWFDDGLGALKALPHLTVSGDVVLIQNDWPDQYA